MNESRLDYSFSPEKDECVLVGLLLLSGRRMNVSRLDYSFSPEKDECFLVRLPFLSGEGWMCPGWITSSLRRRMNVSRLDYSFSPEGWMCPGWITPSLRRRMNVPWLDYSFYPEKDEWVLLSGKELMIPVWITPEMDKGEWVLELKDGRNQFLEKPRKCCYYIKQIKLETFK